jgi:nicotinamide-nucleotide adenylyltransferase
MTRDAPGSRVRQALGCVTGRFQPVHEQHLDLIGIALDECEHVIVAVTNPDPGTWHQEPSSTHRHTATANPFTFYERARLLAAACAAQGWTQRTTVLAFDLARRESWPHYVPAGARQYVRAYSDWEREKAHWFEAAGYRVRLLEGDDRERRSASAIRALMAACDDDWERLVPPATVTLLRQFLAQRPMQART